MNKIKELLYQYRLLVIVVCLILISGCAFAIYSSFSNDDDYLTSVKDGQKTVVETEDITITKDDLYEYFLNYDGEFL